MRDKAAIAAEIITSLRQLASGLQDMADLLKEETQTTSSLATEEKPDAPAVEAVTLEQVRKVLASLSVAGHGAEVRGIIAKYGAAKLSDIAPEHLPEVLKEAETIGK